MKTLFIMRHGEAENIAPTDMQRPLTTRGKVDVQAAGQCLLSQQAPLAHIWVSPYFRTQQTADGILSTLGDSVHCSTKGFLVPESNPQQVLNEMAQSDYDHLLLISHQPLVSRLITLLTHGESNINFEHLSVAMSPASLAMLTTEHCLSACFELNWLRHAPLFDRS